MLAGLGDLYYMEKVLESAEQEFSRTSCVYDPRYYPPHLLHVPSHQFNVKSIQDAMNGLKRDSVRDKYKVRSICSFPII